MISNIDETFPEIGIDQPSLGFRDNFAAAKSEIEELQNTKIDIDGSVAMIAPLTLSGDPGNPLEAATKQYVDASTTVSLQNVIEDLTPQLGGNLDVLNRQITSSVLDGNIVLNPIGTGSIDTVSSRIINVADPAIAQDAATKNYVDNQILTTASSTHDHDTVYVNLTGDSMIGFLTLNSDPTVDLHAATKLYVDTVAQGLSVKESVHVASAVGDMLGSTYTVVDAGTDTGVGDILTASANGDLTLDGVDQFDIDPNAALLVAQRVLIKDHIIPQFNGIYTITDLGSGGTPWILTRAVDFDNSPTGEIPEGSFTFIQFGTLHGSSGWTLSGKGSGVGFSFNITNDTSGTSGDPLVFIQFSDAAAIISSVFGRTGAIVSVTGDYTASQITNVPAGSITGTDVQAALADLDSVKADKTLAISAGTGLTGGGTLASAFSLSHADTSTLVNQTGSTANVLTSLVFDTFGHVTGATLTDISSTYKATFTENTGFNKNFGTIVGTVSEGNHTHSFSSITGTVDFADLPVGTTALTVSEGNHTHTGSTISALDAGDTTTGVFNIARIPTGTSGTTVSLGNHSHASAPKLTTARTISLAGDATGSTLFDGSSNVIITVVIGSDNHTHTGSTISNLNASDTTAGVFNIARIPTGTSGSTVSLGNHTHTNLVAVAGDTMTGNLVQTAQFRGKTGALASPSYAFSSDTNTGMFSGGNAIILFSTDSVERMRLDSAGMDLTGTIIATGNITAFSDRRLKENIQTIDNALDMVIKIRGVSYDRKDTGEHMIGFVAQELEEILPELVIENKDGIKSVAYGNMVALLVEAIKEQQKQIDELKNRLGS